jgi:Zn-dependent M28 family amino/carboxypeptidase
MKSQHSLFVLVLSVNLLFCGKVIPQFDEQRAFNYLEEQCAFGPRNPGSESAKQCLNYLETELKKFADKVVKQPFQHYDKRNKKTLFMTNLIASFNSNQSQRIFLAAHWDTRPMADRDPDPLKRNTPILGANDGASGVAVLLAIARNLFENQPDIGVDIIFFDGEDFGEEGNLDEYFLGSKFFAKHAVNYKPRFGILVDMIGDAQLNIPIEGFSQEYLPFVVEKVWSTAESLGETAFENRLGSYINDDHKMLIEKGIPCIDIIDFAFPDESHRYWHTLEDTPDKCSPESLGSVGRVLLNVIYNEQVN